MKRYLGFRTSAEETREGDRYRFSVTLGHNQAAFLKACQKSQCESVSKSVTTNMPCMKKKGLRYLSMPDSDALDIVRGISMRREKVGAEISVYIRSSAQIESTACQEGKKKRMQAPLANSSLSLTTPRNPCGAPPPAQSMSWCAEKSRAGLGGLPRRQETHTSAACLFTPLCNAMVANHRANRFLCKKNKSIDANPEFPFDFFSTIPSP